MKQILNRFESEIHPWDNLVMIKTDNTNQTKTNIISFSNKTIIAFSYTFSKKPKPNSLYTL